MSMRPSRPRPSKRLRVTSGSKSSAASATSLAAAEDRGLLADVQTLHLDRGYDSATIRRACTDAGIDDVICARRRPPGTAQTATPVPLGQCWAIERTNSRLSNFG